MKNKYIRLIVIAYIAINILGVIVYYLMPKENFVQAKVEADLKQLENIRLEVMSNPQLLDDKSVKDKYNIKNYNFNYAGKDLKILFAKEGQQVFINRKISNDNKIEVYWYLGPMVVNGADFGNIIKAPNIELFNNNLNVKYEKQDYSFTQFSKDPVINQFYVNKDDKNKGIVGSFGSSIMYIKIPKDLEVLGAEAYQYIND